MGKQKKLEHSKVEVTRQETEVRIEQIENPAVRFENNKAGISVHVEYRIWRELGQPSVLIVTSLVVGTVKAGKEDRDATD
jgi:hypothetical protein